MVSILFLAQVMGLYFTILAIALFVNHHNFRTLFIEASNQKHIIILSGLFSLIFGLIIIIIGINFWNGIAIFINLIGWFAVITGILRLFFTNWCCDNVMRLSADSPYYVLSAVLLILGLVLIFFGFIWPLTFN